MSADDHTLPLPPDTGYLHALTEQTARAVTAAEPLDSPYHGAPTSTRDHASRTVTGQRHALVELSRDLHAHPEEGFAEHHAVHAVAELLAEHGYEPQIGLAGLDTAFRASAGNPNGPHIAVLAEYDALPGLGHACGHNVICAAGVGGFLGAAELAGQLGARVSLIGTPAEEGGGGKETLARAGAFADVDAVEMLHPFSHDVAVHPFLGRRQVEMIFHGVGAHAAAQPFMGRNALDAAVAAYQGVAALRQHLPPSDRVHGVFTDGGARPNVVPERAAVLFYFRSPQPNTLRDLGDRLERIAIGAAAMTGCGFELVWDHQPAYLPIRCNETLARRWAVNQRPCARTALPAGVVPEFLTGSTDLGNLSYRLPAMHPMIAIGDSTIALHTKEFRDAAGSAGAEDAVADGAVGLALTALDYLADADLRAAVHEEFAAEGGPLDVPSFFD